MFLKLTSQKYQIFRLQTHLSWQTGMPEALGSTPSKRQLVVVAYTCKPSTWKVRVGRTEVQLHESLSKKKILGFCCLGSGRGSEETEVHRGPLEKGLLLEISSSKGLAGSEMGSKEGKMTVLGFLCHLGKGKEGMS